MKKDASWERRDRKTQYAADFKYAICNKEVEINVAFHL